MHEHWLPWKRTNKRSSAKWVLTGLRFRLTFDHGSYDSRVYGYGIERWEKWE